MRLARRVAAALGALLALAGLGASERAYRGDLAGAAFVSGEAASLSDAACRDRVGECLRLDPAAWIPLVPAARELSRRGDEEGALAVLEEARRRHAPFEGRLLSAAILAERGRTAEAVRAFESVHRLAPTNRAAVQYLIGLYAGAKDVAALERVATESERAWPGGFDALVALKNAALERGDPRAARVFLRAALESADRPEPHVYEMEAERAALSELEAQP